MSSPPDPDQRLERLARLTIEVGVNLQPGQTLAVNALVEQAPFVRALGRAAYAAGARFVDVLYGDQHVRHAHIEHAADDDLGYSPPWLVERIRRIGERGDALVALAGNPEPDLFADLDGDRVGAARMRDLSAESLKLTDGLSNWSIVAYPSEGWARTIFGEPDLERLWAAVETACRLDEDDPVIAWREHIAKLERRASGLSARKFDALRYRGPGTDLTVGLHPESEWQTALDESRGIKHVANMPTEEVFTTPDARRAEGVVSATLPLQIPGTGTIVRDLVVRFENGHAVEITASAGEDVMRKLVEADEGAVRLGEVALVDADSRVGKTGLVFYDTLFDENASSHIALGASIVQAVAWAPALEPEERSARGVNHSSIHTDFMIGSPDLVISGVDADGNETVILRDGIWQLH